MDRTKSCGQIEFHESDVSSYYSESRQMDLEFVDENARMSFFDEEEHEMDVVSVHSEDHIDENADSGLGSMSRGKIPTTPSSFCHFFDSPDSAKISREFSAIMEISTENLAFDLSDHEKDTLSSLDFLEKKVETKSPGRRRLGLQDITNCRRSTNELNVTPCKSSPIKRVRKLFDRKRSCVLFKNVPSTSATNSQLQNRKRRGDFLLEKRISPEGIPAAARPIRRIQSTSILESSFNSDCLSPEFVEHYSLRTVEKPYIEDTAFRSINGQTLAELLNSFTTEQFLEKFILIDCRYPFEYDGGHVKNAMNVYQPEHVQSIFYPECPKEFSKINAKIPIFYCEFSQKRGPTMARELRSCDRKINEQRYPHLDYPEIYVLDHGYRRFFENGSLHHLCEPQHYVPMLQAHSGVLSQFRQHRRRR